MSVSKLVAILESEGINCSPYKDRLVCDYGDGHDFQILKEIPNDLSTWTTEFKNVNARRKRFIEGLLWWAKLNIYEVEISAFELRCWKGNDVAVFELGRELSNLLLSQDEFAVFQHMLSFQCAPKFFNKQSKYTYEQALSQPDYGIIPFMLFKRENGESEWWLDEDVDNSDLRSLLSYLACNQYFYDPDGWVGRDKREYRINIDEIKTSEHVNDWLKKNNLLPAFSHIAKKECDNVILFRELAEKPISLPLLSHYNFDELDQKAESLLTELKQRGFRNPFKHWSNPFWYRPEIDAWADAAWWKNQAIQSDDDLFKAVFGDEAASASIIENMKSYEEFGWSQIFTIYEGVSPLKVFWAREHAWLREDIADYFCTSDFSDAIEDFHWRVIYPDIPYEIKRRAKNIIKNNLMYTDEDINLEQICRALRVFEENEYDNFLDSEDLSVIHRCCLQEASKYLPEGYKIYADAIEIAHYLGWTDVFEAYNMNQSFWNAWETWPEMQQYMDEIALILSCSNQKSMAQRMAAPILSLTQDDLINKVGRKEIAELDARELQYAAAIVWSRCQT